MELLLLELLYRTDYGKDFDREVRRPAAPPIRQSSLGPRGIWRVYGGLRARLCTHMLVCVHMCACSRACVWGSSSVPTDPSPQPPGPACRV